jgi:hypothetical protein
MFRFAGNCSAALAKAAGNSESDATKLLRLIIIKSAGLSHCFLAAK